MTLNSGAPYQPKLCNKCSSSGRVFAEVIEQLMPPAGVMRLETHSVKLLHTKPQRFDRIHLSSDVIHRYLGHGPKGLQTRTVRPLAVIQGLNW